MNAPLVEYLQAQPADFVLRWYCDGITPDRPFEGSWVDVWFENMIAWTIVAPWEEQCSVDDLRIEPDLIGAYLYDDGGDDRNHVGTAVFDVGSKLDDEDLARIAQAQALVEHTPLWVGTPAWSVSCINRALSEWCLKYVGRMVTVECDVDHGPSPYMAKAIAAKEAIEAGLEPTYLLVPGEKEGGEGYSVRVTEEVMEILMQAVVDEDDE